MREEVSMARKVRVGSGAPRTGLWQWPFQNHALEFLPALESVQTDDRCPRMEPEATSITFWPHVGP